MYLSFLCLLLEGERMIRSSCITSNKTCFQGENLLLVSGWQYGYPGTSRLCSQSYENTSCLDAFMFRCKRITWREESDESDNCMHWCKMVGYITNNRRRRLYNAWFCWNGSKKADSHDDAETLSIITNANDFFKPKPDRKKKISNTLCHVISYMLILNQNTSVGQCKKKRRRLVSGTLQMQTVFRPQCENIVWLGPPKINAMMRQALISDLAVKI